MEINNLIYFTGDITNLGNVPIVEDHQYVGGVVLCLMNLTHIFREI